MSRPSDRAQPPASPPDDASASDGLDRRGFLRLVGAGAGAGLAAVGAGAGAGLATALASPTDALAVPGGGAPGPRKRAQQAYRMRVRAARLARRRERAEHVANGDEVEHAGFIGCYTKGLPHDAQGFVEPAAYAALLDCLEKQVPAGFEEIPLAGPVRLTSPQAGLAFDLQGPDAWHVTIPPAPRIALAECAGEMVELYWMALLRDVPFAEYESHPLAQAAAAELDGLQDFRGPREGQAVTPGTLFRGFTAGDGVGPWLSQFLWLDVPWGAQRLVQRNQTGLPGVDYLTDFGEWLAVQNGANRFGQEALDPVPRYVRDLRGLARYVQIDALYQAYLHACLILLARGVPFDPGMPLAGSATQAGFAEWGPPHVLSLMTEVATRALKAVWYQKWFVHRRLRPEEFGGLVHRHKTGAASAPLHADVLECAALEEIFALHGSYLLPLAFPEGCPTHPSYGSGHATVAGACTTILKAWFDTDAVLEDPVVPSADGTALLPYGGPPLTVGGELDKLASNVATGRNGAGVHWRSDYAESVRLGERVALAILEEQKATYAETPTLTLTTFDGETIEI